MARLTNEEIRRMTIDQADAYTDAHPAEAWRFVKVYGAAAAQQTKKAVKVPLHEIMSLQARETNSHQDKTFFYVYTTNNNVKGQENLGQKFFDCLRRNYKRG